MAVIIRGRASPPALGPGGVITISDCLSPALAHSPEIRPGRPSEEGSSRPWLNWGSHTPTSPWSTNSSPYCHPLKEVLFEEPSSVGPQGREPSHWLSGVLNSSFSFGHRNPCPPSSRYMPYGVSPPCWKLLASPTSMEPSWWGPSSPWTTTWSWYGESWLMSQGRYQIGNRPLHQDLRPGLSPDTKPLLKWPPKGRPHSLPWVRLSPCDRRHSMPTHCREWALVSLGHFPPSLPTLWYKHQHTLLCHRILPEAVMSLPLKPTFPV